MRNTIIRERCGYELSVRERIERNVLKWFGHVEGMEEERLVKVWTADIYIYKFFQMVAVLLWNRALKRIFVAEIKSSQTKKTCPIFIGKMDGYWRTD